MPTHCVLGGTGSCGSAVTRALLASPSQDQIRVYVRSQKKLLDFLPQLADNPRVSIVEGSFNDQGTAIKCLEGGDSIFACIAVTSSEPGESIAQDQAASIISALQAIRGRSSTAYSATTVVMLSSSSVNPKLQPRPPALVERLVHTALYYIYADLEKAQDLYLKSHKDGLLVPIFAHPPGIMPGTTPTGHEISTTKNGDIISFADVGAAMVEMSKRKGEFAGQGVGIIATGKVKADWSDNAKVLVRGWLVYFMPVGLWKWGRDRGWW